MQTRDVKPASLECIAFCQQVAALVCKKLEKADHSNLVDARQTAIHTAYKLYEGPQRCRDPAQATEIIYQEITGKEVVDETSVTPTPT